MALVDKTIVDTVHRQVKELGDAIVLEFEGRQTTFRQFDLNSNKVAKALVVSGIKPGDHIAYLGKNSDTYFELMIGDMKVGELRTPVNWRIARPDADCPHLRLRASHLWPLLWRQEHHRPRLRPRPDA